MPERIQPQLTPSTEYLRTIEDLAVSPATGSPGALNPGADLSSRAVYHTQVCGVGKAKVAGCRVYPGGYQQSSKMLHRVVFELQGFSTEFQTSEEQQGLPC